MKKEILFASRNAHKADEIKAVLPDQYKLITLADLNWSIEIPEPFETYKENAVAKATFVFQRTGVPCFSDDSGLAINYLRGRPGVHSAHYAGPGRIATDNMDKVIHELKHITDRSAYFYTVIAYAVSMTEIKTFEGIVRGNITYAPKGNKGFGYDPIFIPEGYEQTFGEMDDALKNQISHRAKAMEKFISYLQKSI